MKIPTGKWTSVLGLILCLSMSCKKRTPSSPLRENAEYTIRVKGVLEHSDTYVNIREAIVAGTFCIAFSFLLVVILKSSPIEYKPKDRSRLCQLIS